MAKTPITFVPKISGDVPWHTAHHITLLYQKLNSLAVAVSQIQPGTTTNNTTINETGGGGGAGLPSMVGAVNDQSGETAYTTMPSDNGTLVVLNDASAIAVTLGVAATTPWFTVFANMGTGTATLTPASGNISYFANPGASSMPLLGGYWAWVGFDGTNFWAAVSPIVPVDTPGVAHEWLASYDATTGAFTLSQPDYSDLTGKPQLPNTMAPVAGEYLTGYDALTGNFSISTTPGISATITTAALTPTGTQGSMTFVDGILTAQVQAT